LGVARLFKADDQPFAASPLGCIDRCYRSHCFPIKALVGMSDGPRLMRTANGRSAGKNEGQKDSNRKHFESSDASEATETRFYEPYRNDLRGER
jgi:hypothetical protein